MVTVAVGWFAGGIGPAVPHVEAGIVLSVVVLGLLVASGRRLALPLGIAGMVGFGFVHGLAHGVEIVGAASAGIGLVTATATLHGIGLALGIPLVRAERLRLATSAGVAIAVTGVLLPVL